MISNNSNFLGHKMILNSVLSRVLVFRRILYRNIHCNCTYLVLMYFGLGPIHQEEATVLQPLSKGDCWGTYCLPCQSGNRWHLPKVWDCLLHHLWLLPTPTQSGEQWPDWGSKPSIQGGLHLHWGQEHQAKLLKMYNSSALWKHTRPCTIPGISYSMKHKDPLGWNDCRGFRISYLNPWAKENSVGSFGYPGLQVLSLPETSWTPLPSLEGIPNLWLRHLSPPTREQVVATKLKKFE